MPRLLLTLLVASLPLATLATTSPNAKPPVITSQAQLDRYLHDTPIEATPLAPLSPGGRKRFLHELGWGSRGLGTLPRDDIQAELTHEKVLRLLALFDAQSHAKGVGLSASEQHLRQTERAAYAKARGCVIGHCPESAIEQRYDELVLQSDDYPPAMPDSERLAQGGMHYDRLFTALQASTALRSTPAPDLRLLKRAAEFASKAAPSDAHITQLRLDLDTMQRRGMVDDQDYAPLYGILVTNRKFTDAAKLQRDHPSMGTHVLPVFLLTKHMPANEPTALAVNDATHTMRRKAISLDGPLRIVVIAGCHFSEDAARAIRSDPQLHKLFADRSIWLSSQNNDLSAVTDWNRQFSDLPMHVAWNDREWSMLDSWGMPTYYVFHDGHLTKKFNGWNGVPALKQSLREAGAL